MPYEIVEHTADIGIRATGRTQEELFIEMARGMFSLIVAPEAVQARWTLRLRACGDQPEGLLVAWLRELLYRFDAEGFLGKEFRICRLKPPEIEAEVSGETLDRRRHPFEREIKAVTYCDLSVARSPEGIWSAQVIFDI